MNSIQSSSDFQAPPAPRLRAQQAPLDFQPMELPQSRDELAQQMSLSQMCLACNELEIQKNALIIENIAQQLSSYLPQEVYLQNQLEAAQINQQLFDLGNKINAQLQENASVCKGDKQSVSSLDDDMLTCDASSFYRQASSFQSQVAVSSVPCTEEEKRQFSESPVHFLFQNQQMAQAAI